MLGYVDVSARQNNTLDSLTQLLETTAADTHKVELLHKLASSHNKYGDLVRSKQYAEEALELSKKMGFQRGIGGSLNIMGVFYIRKEAYKKAGDLLNEALEVGKKNKLYVLTASILNNIAINYSMQGDRDQAMIFLLEALEINKRLNNKEQIGSNLNSIGLIHHVQGRSDTALKYFLEAVAINKEIDNLRGLGFSFANIAQVLERIRNYDEALVYYERALSIFRKLGDRRNQSGVLSNMGIVHEKREEYSTAERCYLQSLELQKALGDKNGMATNLTNMGRLYEDRENHEEALKLYFKAYSIREQIGTKNGLAASYYNLCGSYMYQKNYKQAIHFADKSLQMARLVNNRELIKYIFLRLSVCYESMEDYPRALKYDHRYTNIKDSILNEESNRQITEMRIRFETAEKEQENELLKKEREKQLAELKQKRTQRNVSIAGGVLFLLLAFIWVRSYQQKIKAREQLIIKNKELNRQKNLQLQKEQELESIRSYIKGQEAERGRIAGELHDGIIGSLMAVQLRLSHKAPEGDTTHTQAVEALQKIGEETRVLSHLLSPLTLYSGTFTETLQHFIHNLEKAGELKIYFEAFPEDELNQLDAFLQSNLYRISQELLKNSVKHAYASQLSVQLIRHEEEVNLIVTDDGIGFDPEKKGAGIGMGTIRSRLNLVGGNMHIDSHPGKGSNISIRIPTKHKKEKRPIEP